MDDMAVPMSTISTWPDEQVRVAYTLKSEDVRRLLQLPADHPARARELSAAQSGSELFGLELVRRGLH
jgi:hypothetical protein